MKLIVPRPESVPEVKPWYYSRTVWLNILAIAAILIQYFTGKEMLDTEVQAAILAIINAVLRLRTNQGIEK